MYTCMWALRMCSVYFGTGRMDLEGFTRLIETLMSADGNPSQAREDARLLFNQGVYTVVNHGLQSCIVTLTHLIV